MEAQIEALSVRNPASVLAEEHVLIPTPVLLEELRPLILSAVIGDEPQLFDFPSPQPQPRLRLLMSVLSVVLQMIAMELERRVPRRLVIPERSA